MKIVSALGVCLALLFGHVLDAQAQCQRCGESGRCQGGHIWGGNVCYSECFGGECTCWTSGSCGQPDPGWPPWPWPPDDPNSSPESPSVLALGGDGQIHYQDIEGLKFKIPILYRTLRALTRHAARPLEPGYFEGSHAIMHDGGDYEPAFQFAGFVQLDEDQTSIQLELAGHPHFESVQMSIFHRDPDLRMRAFAVSPGGDRTLEVQR